MQSSGRDGRVDHLLSRGVVNSVLPGMSSFVASPSGASPSLVSSKDKHKERKDVLSEVQMKMSKIEGDVDQLRSFLYTAKDRLTTEYPWMNSSDTIKNLSERSPQRRHSPYSIHQSDHQSQSSPFKASTQLRYGSSTMTADPPLNLKDITTPVRSSHPSTSVASPSHPPHGTLEAVLRRRDSKIHEMESTLSVLDAVCFRELGVSLEHFELAVRRLKQDVEERDSLLVEHERLKLQLYQSQDQSQQLQQLVKSLQELPPTPPSLDQQIRDQETISTLKSSLVSAEHRLQDLVNDVTSSQQRLRQELDQSQTLSEDRDRVLVSLQQCEDERRGLQMKLADVQQAHSLLETDVREMRHRVREAEFGLESARIRLNEVGSEVSDQVRGLSMRAESSATALKTSESMLRQCQLENNHLKESMEMDRSMIQTLKKKEASDSEIRYNLEDKIAKLEVALSDAFTQSSLLDKHKISLEEALTTAEELGKRVSTANHQLLLADRDTERMRVSYTKVYSTVEQILKEQQDHMISIRHIRDDIQSLRNVMSTTEERVRGFSDVLDGLVMEGTSLSRYRDAEIRAAIAKEELDSLKITLEKMITELEMTHKSLQSTTETSNRRADRLCVCEEQLVAAETALASSRREVTRLMYELDCERTNVNHHIEAVSVATHRYGRAETVLAEMTAQLDESRVTNVGFERKIVELKSTISLNQLNLQKSFETINELNKKSNAVYEDSAAIATLRFELAQSVTEVSRLERLVEVLRVSNREAAASIEEEKRMRVKVEEERLRERERYLQVLDEEQLERMKLSDEVGSLSRVVSTSENARRELQLQLQEVSVSAELVNADADSIQAALLLSQRKEHVALDRLRRNSEILNELETILVSQNGLNEHQRRQSLRMIQSLTTGTDGFSQLSPSKRSPSVESDAIADMVLLVESLQKSLSTTSACYFDLATTLLRLQTRSGDIDVTIDDLKTKIVSTSNAIHSLVNSDTTRYEADILRLKDSVDNAEKQLAMSRDTIEYLTEERSRFNDENQILKNDINKYREELAVTAADLQSSKRQLGEALGVLKTLEAGNCDNNDPEWSLRLLKNTSEMILRTSIPRNADDDMSKEIHQVYQRISDLEQTNKKLEDILKTALETHSMTLSSMELDQKQQKDAASTISRDDWDHPSLDAVTGPVATVLRVVRRLASENASIRSVLTDVETEFETFKTNARREKQVIDNDISRASDSRFRLEGEVAKLRQQLSIAIAERDSALQVAEEVGCEMCSQLAAANIEQVERRDEAILNASINNLQRCLSTLRGRGSAELTNALSNVERVAGPGLVNLCSALLSYDRDVQGQLSELSASLEMVTLQLAGQKQRSPSITPQK